MVLYPTVVESLSGRNPLLRIDFQQFGDEVAALLAEVLGKGKGAEVVLLLVLGEGRLDGQHFVHEYPYAPAVDFVIVEVPLGHFGGDVVKGPAEGLPLDIGLDGPPEIGYF